MIHEIGQCRVDELDPGRGQFDVDSPAITGIDMAGDQASPLQFFQSLGYAT